MSLSEGKRSICMCIFFFFQAEDGIRDYKVTGVQTCALPISDRSGSGTRAGGPRRVDSRQAQRARRSRGHHGPVSRVAGGRGRWAGRAGRVRSEERRVGEEGRSRWSPYHLKKKKKISR